MSSKPPLGDQPLDFWLQNLVTVITPAPTSMGLVVGDVTSMTGLATDYHDRLVTATEPTTRTRATVAGKQVSKKAALAKARELVRKINAYPALTAAQRADLDLNPRDVTPSPIGPPTTYPVLSLGGVGPLTADLRTVDVATPTRRAKPAGTIGCEVWVKIGGPAPESVEQCRYLMLATRNRTTLTFAPADANQTAYLIGRWINERGQPGPVSPVLTLTVAAPMGFGLPLAA
ncbi:MAG TPA: hypothetical protein VEA69_05565 [Tepidisphaeraceae bacterium]|nr:hypothetical protein [Tepidisphaeraceae bacterium]